ncbi:MAG: transglutaminase domain-containing protein [Alsobacter sp.]
MTGLSRRTLLRTGAAGLAIAALPGSGRASPGPGWRSFIVTMRTEVKAPKGETRLWLPVPSSIDADWVRADEPKISTSGQAAIEPIGGQAERLLSVTFPASAQSAVAEVVTVVETRDRQVDFATPAGAAGLAPDQAAFYTRGTELIPVDGIVKDTAATITAGATTDLEKARAIYEWVVDNTFRNPKTRGCGTGDVAGMLKSGNLGGKCADINALYVGLARASGLPARDVYGIRVAPSRRGFKSLGASSEVISKSQHCRAEVWLAGFGWVPIDPADVRKVALEEPPGNLPLTSEPVRRARELLFGAWEMNWVPYNTAHDLKLQGASGTLPFLMYPTGQTGDATLDSLDPDAFSYTITSREIVS